MFINVYTDLCRHGVVGGQKLHKALKTLENILKC